LNLLFLHLDTIFNITDKHKALVIPYFLQNEFENDNPFYRNVNSLKKDDFIPQTNKLELDYLKEVIDGFGNVTIFNAGSGNEEHTGLKLIDYLQQYKRFSFAYAGGAPKTTSIEQQQHLVEVVFPELYFQAANVIATKPGKVIIYEKDTLETQKSLRESGVSVSVFDAGELRRWHGGPHCMTFPISRSSI
jgi:arginine deiminase